MKKAITLAVAASLALPALADNTERWWKPKCKTPKYAGLYNISTRGFVGDGPEALIGGFIIKANHRREKLCVVIRGRGQSLPASIPNRLEDPRLRLVRLKDKKVLATNDDWRDSRYADIIADTFHGHLTRSDAGIFICLKPGGYTATLRGAGHRDQGIGIVEILDVEFDDKFSDYRCDDDDDSSDDDD